VRKGTADESFRPAGVVPRPYLDVRPSFREGDLLCFRQLGKVRFLFEVKRD
jgi:hypothetical protein